MFSKFKIIVISILFVSMASMASAEPTYLNDQNITISLGSSMAAEPFANQTTATSLANVIDAPSADAPENHTQPAHVWVSGGSLELDFDFGLEYDLTTVHFWNYFGEGFDVDNLDFTFFDSSKTLVGSLLGVVPVLGGGGSNPIFAEDYDLAFPSNIQFVNVVLTGTNNEVDFNNIGFTGELSPLSAPDISITPLSHAFGDVTVDNTADRTFMLNNDGNASLAISTIDLADALSPPFSIVLGEDNCSEQNLSPAENCTFDVRFEPTEELTSNDSFDIPSNDPDENPLTVNLSGTGVAVPVPDISVTPLSHAFGNVTVGNTADKTFTLSNDGNASLSVNIIALVDVLSPPFSIVLGQDNCSGQNLSPAANCTFDVRFGPIEELTSNDSFDIPSNDLDENPITVNLSGTGVGVPVPDISVIPLSHVFGDVTVGNTAEKTFTLKNDGNASLSVNTIALANVLATPFSVVSGQDNCSGQNLAPAGNCTFDIRFEPTNELTSNDSFDIPSNDPDENPLVVNLSGTGLSASVNQPPTAPELVFPANGATVSESDVTFGWNRSTDPDGDAITYTLSVCEDEAFTIGCIADNVVSVEKSREINYVGLSLSFSLVFGLVIIRSSNRRRNIGISMVILMISALLISGCDSGGGGGGGQVAPVADITKNVTGLTAGKTYHWQVIADDGNGGETPSEVWDFISQ